MRAAPVVLLHDVASRAGAGADVDLTSTLDAVQAALEADAPVERLPVDAGGAWLDALRASAPGLVVNLCEGIEGRAAAEPAVAAALELLGIPFTGSGSWTLALCLRKGVANALLAAAGVPVPAWRLVRRGDPIPDDLPFPLIVKPAAEDASVGVDQEAVVRTPDALARRLARLHARFDELLVQRYVAGRELNVGIVGARVLPVAEISFAAMPAACWPIVTWRSKWEPGCDEDVGARPVCPAPVDARLRARLETVAHDAWRAVGGRGYGRVDVRVDDEGHPWVLEVNANPDLAPDAGLARMAAAAGWSYGELLGHVCAAARGTASDAAPAPQAAAVPAGLP